jgi:uncharacterized protein YdhG (YjbR/CyaY superfamily)
VAEATAGSIEEVDQYLENLEPARRGALSELRSLILETVPDVVESMRYKMPTYGYGEAIFCAFASQKHYMSLYVEPRILNRHRTALDHLSLGKSCIRFKSIGQFPLGIVRTLIEETVQALEKRGGVEHGAGQEIRDKQGSAGQTRPGRQPDGLLGAGPGDQSAGTAGGL